MKQNDHSFFQNKDCQYFPCHKTDRDDFNWLCCDCPLYALGDRCGGNFRYTEKGIKDCTNCLIPHSPNGYDYVLAKYPQIAELAKQNRK